tara:strand:+ start:2345 stop:3070 length:726 start_codon:yes stop_codon:yes gene_type:complete
MTTPSWWNTSFGNDKQYFGRVDYIEALRKLAKGSDNKTDVSKLAGAGKTIADYIYPGDPTRQAARSGLKIGTGLLDDIRSAVPKNFITGQYGTDKTKWGLADYYAMRSWGYTDKHIWEKFLKNKTTGFETGQGVSDAQGVYKQLQSKAAKGWPQATTTSTAGANSDFKFTKADIDITNTAATGNYFTGSTITRDSPATRTYTKTGATPTPKVSSLKIGRSGSSKYKSAQDLNRLKRKKEWT